MKKEYIIAIIMVLVIVAAPFILNNITGKAIRDPKGASASGSGEHSIGPSAEEQACMISCMGCTSPGVDCTGDSEQCTKQCNMQKPETTEETSCMEECVVKGCGEFDFDCQGKNKENCEKECDMLGDKPDESEMSAEQLCITKCVEAVDSMIRCGASQTGETGNEVCQKCASECVHLYEGPCLDDEKLKAKQKECKTCEHCYGEPVMGDSGEGWECIVSVECKDASAEFGDEPGTGEGIVANVGEAIGNVFEGIGNFFKGLFGGGEE